MTWQAVTFVTVAITYLVVLVCLVTIAYLAVRNAVDWWQAHKED